MNKAIERQINQIYSEVYKKVFNNKNLAGLASGQKSGVYNTVASLNNSQQYEEFAMKFAKALAKKGLASQRGIWRKYFEAARAAHYIALPKTFNQYEAQIMSKAVKQNFTMIKTIPDKMIEIMNHKYTSTLIEEVAKGTLPRGSFRRMLASHGSKNAGVIARTETAKLQTAILESRATDLGSVAYTWLSSNDKRTRPSHRAMNGVVVFWKHKPLLDKMTGHAGEFPNCRCSPNPIMDEDDLTKSNYKVYDYRNDTIIILSKKQLIEALEKGGLE